MSFRNNPKLKGLKILKPADAWAKYKQNNQYLDSNSKTSKLMERVVRANRYKYQKLPPISTSIICKYPSLIYRLNKRNTPLFQIIE